MRLNNLLAAPLAVVLSVSATPTFATGTVALKCQLAAGEPTPPMFVTFGSGSSVVQVTIAGQTAFHDTFSEGSIIWWQFKGENGIIVRSRLNRADGSIVITNEHPFGVTKRQTVKGNCGLARNKF